MRRRYKAHSRKPYQRSTSVLLQTPNISTHTDLSLRPPRRVASCRPVSLSLCPTTSVLRPKELRSCVMCFRLNVPSNLLQKWDVKIELWFRLLHAQRPPITTMLCTSCCVHGVRWRQPERAWTREPPYLARAFLINRLEMTTLCYIDG